MLLRHDGHLMGELLLQARAAWPGVELEPAVFASYLGSRLPSDVESERALRQMRTSDLYLACACARGDVRAIAAFEERCLSVVDHTLRRMAGMDAGIIGDIKQQLRIRLFVGDRRAPQILDFSGCGELRRWVRVLAVRQALVYARRARRETPAEGRLIERALLSGDDPERDYFKTLYRKEFTTAIADALRTLSVHEQTLLRQSFVDRLSIDELGRLHGVHRATAARWLGRAQRRLSKATHVVLMRRLKVRPSDLHSILKYIRSGLQVSLRIVFPSRRRRRRVLAGELP